jgi:hypothetical protein
MPHAEIPGLGEQPHAPYAIAAQAAAEEAPGPIHPEVEPVTEVAAAASAQPDVAPSSTQPADFQPAPAQSVEEHPVGDKADGEETKADSSEPVAPKLEIVTSEVAEEAEAEAKPAPDPQPEPRARRTGITRKGWWQRSLG